MEQFPLNIQLHIIRRTAEAPATTIPFMSSMNSKTIFFATDILLYIFCCFIASFKCASPIQFYFAACYQKAIWILYLYTNARFAFGKHHFTQTQRIYNYDAKVLIVACKGKPNGIAIIRVNFALQCNFQQ